MKLLGAACAIVLAVGLRSGISDSAFAISQPVFDTLTPIDSLPSSQQITTVFNNSTSEALSSLQQIAHPPGGTFVDRGVQLRAVRALIHYCAATPCADGDPAHQTLVAIASDPIYRDARSGSDLLVLRAALESLGVLRVPADLGVLVPQLQHPSRDIRAAVARGLRDLGNTQAITPLRARYNVEQEPQVQTAISDALRVLGQ